MGWKTILIESENKFSIKNNFLKLTSYNDEKEKEKEIKISLEEIDLIIIQNYKSWITIRTLIELSKKNITFIICDLSHDPISMLIPLALHHKPLQNFNLQIEQNSRSKNILHKEIIKQKIINQKSVLIDIEASEEIINKFSNFANDVLQGDKTNREAVSAKMFFKEIYGSSFVRFYDDGINSFMNFGYKILASKISNCLIKYGLHPTLGVFHKNKSNYFNLSYDFIEPFRPLVDWLANYLKIELKDTLTISLKLKILRILDMKVQINEKIYLVKNAIDIMVKSYISFLQNEREDLSLPTIHLSLIKEQIDKYEFKEF
ncbi:MAG: CRISPR-associated endonuclease Cas1 [Candidatus Tyloplasma litorale]|nr:MAG: CRISPR-associated endonuclease Cas1 [Mycoplasmatales bacterium]